MCRALLPVPHTSLILSLLLITATDNKLIFYQNVVQFLSLTSCHDFTQNILHHKYKSQPVYVILSQFRLPTILSTYSYLPKKFIIWWMVHQVSSKITATIYAVWGCIVVLKDHTFWHNLFQPLKQCLGGCQLHSNAEVEFAVCECLQMQDLITAGTQFETRMKMGQMHHCSHGLYYGALVDFHYGGFCLQL